VVAISISLTKGAYTRRSWTDTV